MDDFFVSGMRIAVDINVGKKEVFEGMREVIGLSCLCLRGKCLDRIIEKYFSGVSRRDLVQSLKDVDALKLVAKKIQSKLEENVSME